MRRFDGERTSFLSHARANDDEAYRQSQARRRELGQAKPGKKKQTVELYEYSRTVELLAQISELLQQNVHYTATHGTKAARKKPKVARYPVPTTSAKRVQKSDERKAFESVEAVLVFTDEPYEDNPDLVQERTGRPEDYAEVVETAPEPAAGAQRPRPHRMRPADPSRAQDEPPFNGAAAFDAPQWFDDPRPPEDFGPLED